MIPVVDNVSGQIGNARGDRPKMQQQCKSNANALVIQERSCALSRRSDPT
jgi:hypothetical protein